MKKATWLLIPLLVLLSACPFESNTALESSPVEPVDSSLCGYWYGIVKDGSDFFGIEALDITRQSDSVYAITRYGKAVKGDIILPDTAYFTGYTSWLEGRRYMNVVADIVIDEPRKKGATPVRKKQRVYYLAALALQHDTLQVRTITETFSIKKQFASGSDLKQAVTGMLSKEEQLFDEQYSLFYRKISRPQQLKAY